MTAYHDIHRDSGISAYEYGADWIRIRFKSRAVYEYRSAGIGAGHIRTMKRLADAGDGLTAYISTNPDVKRGYSMKL